jgi:HK97 family phage prohead protease
MKNLLLICEAKVNLEQNADGNQSPSGKIEARITTWGAREGADGRKFFYKPEGFHDWAKEFTEASKPMPMFLNHNDMGMPVGQWTEFNFDDEGMTASGRIYTNTVSGSDLYTILKESPSLFGGVSVGAYAEEAVMVNADGEPDQSDEAYFQITKGGIREVSVVMYPNNPQAEIQKLEYFDDKGQPNPRTIEKSLRDAGCSKKDAATASSLFKKLLLERDAQLKPIEQAPLQSDSDAVVTEADILAALERREFLSILNKRI